MQLLGECALALHGGGYAKRAERDAAHVSHQLRPCADQRKQPRVLGRDHPRLHQPARADARFSAISLDQIPVETPFTLSLDHGLLCAWVFALIGSIANAEHAQLQMDIRFSCRCSRHADESDAEVQRLWLW